MIDIRIIKVLETLEHLDIHSYQLIFHGEIIDERTSFVVEKISSLRNDVCHKVKWDNISKKMIHDEHSLSLPDFRSRFENFDLSKILLDSTSLDFPELVYILDLFKNKNIDIDVVYLEPSEYLKKHSDIGEYNFDLTCKQQNFSGLPEFSVHTGNHSVSLVAPLGFEPMRLGQLINSDEGKTYDSISGMVAIPAYKPGWENRSIKSNLRHFSNTLSPELLLYPSANPYQIYKQMDSIAHAFPQLLLAPLGTKPSTLAIALYMVNNFPNNTRKSYVSAVYDFPEKTSGRTKGIGKVYLYKLYASKD
ncbi:hypothetical protein H8F06_21665 [Vibrio fluvialis]|uniref:hypothetical protein n=1 Tax=Vibrio fluvialis TaxID=676 RepID=UPI00192AE431|nr:hypothetical protein [Vibrio fluvialis]MBL4297890.1 hypothetical protein [Vibrio fluvialis]